MGAMGLLALLSGVMLSAVFSSSDVEVLPSEEPDVGPDEEPETPEVVADTGASFVQSESGVELELGDDETGSLAVVYYEDTEDNEDDFFEIYEARFYLVPEGVDWSEVSWETRYDVPGADTREDSGPYELADFEAENSLELLGTVDLMGALDTGQTPQDYLGEISSNAPVAGYYLTANTDGDDLVYLLPEDYIITRGGAPETPVTDSTTGTEATDWFSTDTDGITLDGAGGDDVLQTSGDNVTLLGGLGDDTIEASGAEGLVVEGGAGADSINISADPEVAYDATVQGGEGDDRIFMYGGEAYGGEGNDTLSGGARFGGSGQDVGLLDGGLGDDRISVIGEGSSALGDEGDDYIYAGQGGFADGGAGDDTLSINDFGTLQGGTGNDLFQIASSLNEPEGPSVVTTGEGEDTIQVRFQNSSYDETDEVYLTVTDFDPSEDVLQIEPYNEFTFNEVGGIDLVEAQGGTHTDVLVTFNRADGGTPETLVIRLDGTTGLTADSVVVAA